jgi:hypothetical protein
MAGNPNPSPATRFKKGISANPAGRPPAKREWLKLFERCYTAQDYELAIEALKDAILKGEPWAIKLIFDKTLPDKLETIGTSEETVFDRLGI